MNPRRPRNVNDLAALLSEAEKRAPEYPEGWGRKEIEADLTLCLCGDDTPEHPGVLSAEVQAELAARYSGRELLLWQLEAVADLAIASEDPEIQADGRITKSWCAERLLAYEQRRATVRSSLDTGTN